MSTRISSWHLGFRLIVLFTIPLAAQPAELSQFEPTLGSELQQGIDNEYYDEMMRLEQENEPPQTMDGPVDPPVDDDPPPATPIDFLTPLLFLFAVVAGIIVRFVCIKRKLD